MSTLQQIGAFIGAAFKADRDRLDSLESFKAQIENDNTVDIDGGSASTIYASSDLEIDGGTS
jgi:hypothetical protein